MYGVRKEEGELLKLKDWLQVIYIYICWLSPGLPKLLFTAR